MRLIAVDSTATRRLGPQQFPDLREIAPAVDVEFLGFERVGPDRVNVVVFGQFLEVEEALALRRQREQRS